MQKKNEQLYSEIKEKLTSDHLKKITVDVINFYKSRNYSFLREYALIFGIDPGIKSEKIFSLLIRHCHPDKLSLILKQADEIYSSGDYPELLKFHDSYFFTIDSARDVPEIDADLKSEYSFDDDDLSNREREVFENENFAESNLEFGDEPYCFLHAVKKFFYGGYDYDITEYDLENLDGALDLSDTEIEELDGIEHCINLDELNLSNNKIERISKLSTLENLQSLFLSGNNIESISPLAELRDLEILDISFNGISNIDVLLKLGKLEYVNLIGNPVDDYSIIDSLAKRGVMVIFEGDVIL